MLLIGSKYSKHNRIQLGIERLCTIIIAGILVATIICFIVCNIVTMKEYSDTFSAFEWIWLIPTLFIVLIVMMLSYKAINSKQRGMTVGFIIANIIYLSFLLTYRTVPASDWAAIWESAQEMANGTFTDGLVNGTYMHEIPYQLGMAVFESVFVRIFGAEYWPLQIINLLIMNFLIFSVYHLTARKISPTAAMYSFFAAAVFLPWSMAVNQFTNHQMALVFLILTLYCYEKEKLGYAILSGVCLAALNFFRSMGIILVLTFFCMMIYRIIQDKKQWKKAMGCFALFYIVYTICLLISDSALISAGYTDTMVSKSTRNMLHKITYTTYDSSIDGTIADFDYDYEAYDQAYKEEIAMMLREHPKEIVVGTANKMCRYLGMFDYEFEMTYNHDETVWKNYPIKAIYSMQWFQYVIYTVFALIGFFCLKKHSKILDVYQVFFIGNTLVYFFIEAFSSYRQVSYYYFLVLVGYGMSEVTRKNYVSKESKENKSAY